MKIAFRLDDITPNMDMQKFHKAYEIFAKADIKPLIGVVPDCRDELLHYDEKKSDFWNLIRELQKEGWIVAQHGYKHVYETKDSGILGINPFSEFAGLAYEKQLDKIRKGKLILEENDVISEIFMAPGHTYDENTIRALKQCGFSWVTDGYTRQNVTYKNMCFIPCRNEKESVKKGINTICLHTNLMNDSDFAGLENSLKHNNGQYVDFQELLKSKVYPFTLGCRLEQWTALKKYKLRMKVGKSKFAQKYFDRCNNPNVFVKNIYRVIFFPIFLGILFEKKEKY